MSKIRVLVVDDSAFMRKMIPRILNTCSKIEVVGTAMDGVFAMEKIETLRPDVITLDVSMPRMDGIETLRNIVSDFRIPTVMVSSATKKDAELTIQALQIGAFDFVTKPNSSISLNINDVKSELIEKVRIAYENPVSRLNFRHDAPPVRPEEKVSLNIRKQAERVLAIGVSTGGPNALTYMLPQIPADFPAAIVIVQHMPAGFTEMFAMRLNSLCRIEVKEAKEGDMVLPGRALISPGGRHMKIKRKPFGTITVLSDSSSVNGHRPSADVLFRSVASEYGSSATGLIMTGMGDDGADGIGDVMLNGGLTIAQDKESCVVFGMPNEAIKRNHIRNIVSLEDMGEFLINHFKEKEGKYGTDRCNQTYQSV